MNLKSNTAMFSFHSVNLVFYPIQQYSMSMTQTTKPVTAKKSTFSANIPGIKYAKY